MRSAALLILAAAGMPGLIVNFGVTSTYETSDVVSTSTCIIKGWMAAKSSNLNVNLLCNNGETLTLDDSLLLIKLVGKPDTVLKCEKHVGLLSGRTRNICDVIKATD